MTSRYLLRSLSLSLVLLSTLALADRHQASGPGQRRYRGRYVVRQVRVVRPPAYVGFGLRYVPAAPMPPPPPPFGDVPYSPQPEPVQSRSSVSRVSGAAIADVSAFYRAASLGVFAGLEGERFGFATQFAGYTQWDPMLYPSRTFGTLSGALTFAPLSFEHFRLRIHAGVDSIFFQNIAMVGPMFGTSVALHLGGPFGLEGSLDVTPLPFQKAELRLGAWINTGALMFRAGWRTVALNDMGLVDGYARRDIFSGPTVGLGFAF
jgi:hypothetical protein